MKQLVVMFALVAAAAAYGTGAPDSACGDMLPKHKGVPVQTLPFPYVISLSGNSIQPNGKVYVTLSAKPGDSFEGFFIQGRVGGVAAGKFEAAEGVKLVNCGNGVNTGVTHDSTKPKEKVVLAWQAPPSLTEDVIFTVTVARDFATFWVAQESSPLTVSK